MRVLWCHSQDQFCEYLFAEAVKTDNKVLLENKPKFLQVSYCGTLKVPVVMATLFVWVWCVRYTPPQATSIL